MRKSRFISSALSCIMIVVNIVSSPSPISANSTLTAAFPGAEGGGMYSLGARAGETIEIYHVTNLNDSGSGSFRDAVSEDNRIIVFDVAGNITLNSILKIKSNNLTVLGQTAPGEGVCIAGESVLFNGCSNIIIRYMRFRSGDTSLSQEDGLGFRNCTDVIIDHCSISWSVDECLSAYENKNFTAQYCIIAESLNNSIHAKGAHGYGGIWGGINASFHHNLISTHNSRNPRIGTSYTVHTYNDTPDYESLIDIRNNVFYNWVSNTGYGGENNVRVNFVNNYYKPSNASKAERIYEFYGGTENAGTTLHLCGNVIEGNANITKDNWQGTSYYSDNINWTKCENISDGFTDKNGKLWRNDQYLYNYPVTTQDAEDAYNDVLENAGASYLRDSDDVRIIENVINGTYPKGNLSGNGLIDSQNDVGGWKPLYGTAELDSDNDGIPDRWEDENKIDKNVPDSLVITANGYTYLEEYADSIITKPINTNRESLRNAIIYSEQTDSTHFEKSGYEKLQTILTKAKEVLGNKYSTQNEIDSVCDELYKAVEELIPDKSYLLAEAIDKAKSYNKNLYTKDSFETLETAILNGEKLLDSEHNNIDVENAVKEIDSAIAALKISKRVLLNEYIFKYQYYPNMDYYKKSWDEFQKAIENAKKVLNDARTEELDYSDAIDKLNSAFNNLEGDFKEGNISFTVRGSGNTYSSPYNSDDICIVSEKISFPMEQSYYQKIELMCISLNKDNSMYSKNISKMSVSSDSLALKYLKYENGKSVNKTETIPFVFKSNTDYNITAFINRVNKTVKYYINGEVIAVLDLGEYVDYFDEPSAVYMYNNLSTAVLQEHREYTPVISSVFAMERIYNTHIYGDVDCDGIITASDSAVILQKVLLSSYEMPIEPKTSYWLKYADVGNDGIIAADDAAFVLQKVLISTFNMPVEIVDMQNTETTEQTTIETAIETTTDTIAKTSTEVVTDTTDEQPTETKSMIETETENETASVPEIQTIPIWSGGFSAEKKRSIKYYDY